MIAFSTTCSAPDLPYSFYTSPQGGFGGGQIGYNWQTGSVFGPIVFGVEADIQGGGLSDDRTNLSGCCRPHDDL